MKRKGEGSSNDPPCYKFLYEFFYLIVRGMKDVAVCVVFWMDNSLQEMNVP